MEKNIKQILKDLYQIDPTLKTKEQDLIKIINKFLSSRPDTKLDNVFVKKLKQEILGEFSSVRYSVWDNILNTMSYNKFSYIRGGALLLLIVAAPLVYFLIFSNKIPSSDIIDFGFEQKISNTKNNAFGTLALGGTNKESADSVVTRSQTGDGSQEFAVSAPIQAMGLGGGGGGIPVATESMMIAPEYMDNYTYKYIGDTLELKDESLKVLKRNKDDGMGKRLASLFGRANFGLFDISKFNNLDVNNISLSEDVEKGYMMYINSKEGMVSISRNWDKWPQVRTFALERQLTINDIPKDDVLISITDKFLDKYGINKSIYGAPEVDKSWNVYYASAEDKSMISAPGQIGVIYPLLLDGKEVYEQYGTRVGLNVFVDIKENIVLSIDGLWTQNYSSSNYDTVTDVGKVVNFAEQGGINNRVYYSPDSKQPTVLNLDTPKVVYMRYYKYENNINEELFIPALMFTIENMPQSRYYGQRAIMVPLIKDMFDTNTLGDDTGLPKPVPMPLIEGGSQAIQDFDTGTTNVEVSL